MVMSDSVGLVGRTMPHVPARPGGSSNSTLSVDVATSGPSRRGAMTRAPPTPSVTTRAGIPTATRERAGGWDGRIGLFRDDAGGLRRVAVRAAQPSGVDERERDLRARVEAGARRQVDPDEGADLRAVRELDRGGGLLREGRALQVARAVRRRWGGGRGVLVGATLEFDRSRLEAGRGPQAVWVGKAEQLELLPAEGRAEHRQAAPALCREVHLARRADSGGAAGLERAVLTA